MTSIQPREPYTDDQLKALYPAGLELQLVEILMRHGERTPVSARFQNAGLTPFWPYCSAVRQMKSVVLEDSTGSPSKTFTTLEWKRRLETFGENDSPSLATGPSGELDSICDLGMLTDQGRLSTLELGKRLRHLYVDRLGFLPQTISSTDFLYLRSTPVARSLESLQQSFAGLYPANTRMAVAYEPFPPPTILTRVLGDETLLPNDAMCRRYAALSRAFAERTAQRWNASDEMAYLNKLYGKWMPDGDQKVAVDSHPRLSGIMDTINSTLAHGPETRLPKEFYDQKGRDIIEKIGNEEWFAGYKESREYRMLGIGGLLGDITARMVGSAEKSTADGEYEVMQKPSQDPTTIKFGMSGCHDTTLAATLASLGTFNTDKWPPYTSHIAIELFRKSNSTSPMIDRAQLTKAPEAVAAIKSSWFDSFFSRAAAPVGIAPPGIGRKPSKALTPVEKKQLDGYYVRLRYNDSVVSVPGCKAPGNHFEGNESFCTLAAFKSIVDKFTPQNWKEQCRSNIDAPAFPAKPEPAGY